MSTPTPAQRRAAEPARSVWVTANAGTGKTRVLTDRVLRLLLDGAHPESVLCLTFTKAAAAEMIVRIEQRLAEWATCSEAALRAELGGLTGAEPDPRQRDRARQLFASVLELPRGLPIMTIHGLCGALLRRFPIEAGTAPHFETIDDRTAAELMGEAREAVLNDARDTATPLGTAMAVLAVTLAEGSLVEAITEVLGQRVRLVACCDGDADRLIRRVWEALGVDPADTPSAVQAAACADGVFDADGLRGLAAAFALGGKLQGDAAPLVTAWLSAVPADRARLYAEYVGCFLTAKGTASQKIVSEKFRREQALIAQVFDRECARLILAADRARAAILAARTEALLRVGFAVIAEYEARKRHRAALDFDDLIERARLLLDGRSDWVMFKLDERIEHLLVDEAQDTSPAQWAIVERLADEFFSGAGQHARPRTLFVVGDEKQSIYSFQGADLANLVAVRARLRARAGPALVDELLDVSFRSTGAVLAVVDAVLARPEAADGVVQPGTVVSHRTDRRNQAGLVELWPLVEALPDADPAEPWPLPGRPRPADDPERIVASAIARTVAGWLAAGERLASTGAPIRARDVLILLSRRGTAQEQIIRALKQAEIPVAGTDRLALTAHIAVQDLVALGRAVLLPEDDLTFACLLKSPLVGLDDDDLMLLTEDRGPAGLLERLRALAVGSNRLQEALTRVEGWLDRADFMPPFEFYCRVLGAEGGRLRMLGRLGEEAREPIEAFLGQCLAYEEGHPATLEGFLHWLGMGEQQLKRDPESAADAVRVLTAHGAKGLEAPIVFLADAGPHGAARSGRLIWDRDSGLPFWRAAWAEREAITEAAVEDEQRRQEDERRRLLYVGMTRARDRLYVTGWAGRETVPCWHRLVALGLANLDGVMRVEHRLGERFQGPVLRYAQGAAAPDLVEVEPAAYPMVVPGWARRPVADETAAPRPRSPSRLGETGLGNDGVAGATAASRIRRGQIVHKLLELLPQLPEDARGPAASRWLAASADDLDGAERDELVASVLGVIAMPELAAAFGPGSRAEQPLCGTVEGVVIVGQVDRLAVRPEAVLVIDYKTGEAPPDPTGVPVGHLGQMAAYRGLLRQIWPGRPIRCGILWTALPRLDLLPDPLLDAHRPAHGLTGETADT